MLAAAVFLWITATIALQGLHSTVASVRDSASPALLDGIEAQAALSDADRAAWLSFRSGEAVHRCRGVDLPELGTPIRVGGGSALRRDALSDQLTAGGFWDPRSTGTSYSSART
jgi:hypothetical protein